MTDYEPLESEGLNEMAKAARDLSRVSRAFYLGLVEQGFSETEALRLTGNYVVALVRGSAES